MENKEPIAPVTVTDQQAMSQNFDPVLNMPTLNVTHESLDVDQYVGELTTRALTITNNGPNSLDFEILRVAAGFTPLSNTQEILNTPPMPNMVAADQDIVAHLPDTAPNVSISGASILIIQDSYPSGFDSIQQILESHTIAYDQVTSSSMATIDLSAYEMVIIPSLQPNSFYDAWNNHITRFEEYIMYGGALWLSGATSGTMPLAPGGIVNQYGTDFYNNVVSTHHPWVVGVPGQIYGGNWASRNYFTNLTPNSEIVIESTNYEEGTLVDYRIGAGRILLNGLNLEQGWYYNWDSAPILENSLLDMYAWQPGDASWLIVEPISGTVAGYGSTAIQITFDAVGRQPGRYTAELIINDSDLINGSYTAAVTMTLSPTSDMGRVTGTMSDLWTGQPLTATTQLVDVYTTMATPDYAIWADAGVYDLVASTKGYMTITYTVDIPAGDIVTQNIALEPAQPRMELSSEGIDATAVYGDTTSQTLIVTNSGPLLLDVTFIEVPLTRQAPGSVSFDLTGTHILYDRAHGQPELTYYTILYGDLINAGAQIEHNFTYPITAAILEPYDVLWLNCCGNTSWTPGELTAVQAWLEAGGALLIHGGQSSATSSPAEIFDIFYQYGSCIWHTPTNNVIFHPVSQGVQSIYISYACYHLQTDGDATVVLRDSLGRNHLMAHQENGGKIVIVAATDFDNIQINSADNRILANNTMAWLAAPAYGDVPWMAVTPVSATIPGHSNLAVIVDFNTNGLEPGQHVAMLAVEHNDPARPFPIMLAITLHVVEEFAAVSLTANTAVENGAPGETVTYNLTLTNNGNMTDTFDLAVSGNGWVAALPGGTNVTLAAGASATVIVEVTIPADAATGAVDTVMVTATSANDNMVAATATLTTTAVVPGYTLYLPIIMKP